MSRDINWINAVYIVLSLALATTITYVIQRRLPFLTDLRKLQTLKHPSK
jgi:hypothetical protein